MNENAPRPVRRVALVAHDNCKPGLIDWVGTHCDLLARCTLYATGTTGRLISNRTGIDVVCFKSGPLGGDQQIGARIAEGEIDRLVFFWDPLEPMPHDPDIKALLRVATLWNIPVACNRMTADFLIRSPLFESYAPSTPDFSGYVNRSVP